MPKPYDTIVPAELPGSQRFYTYASGVAELATGALLLTPRTRRLGALSAVAVFVGVFPGQRQPGPAVEGQAADHAAGRDRPAAAADPDDHRGAEDLPQLLGQPRSSATRSSAPGSDSGVTVCPDRT